MIDFSRKITGDRPLYTKDRNTQQELMFDFESDRGRIINSAAVRRLQQKTQVFPLERNSAVRSRLTHSLEVQQTGRFIVQTIFKKLTPAQQTEFKLEGLERHLESVVEMACLMHDIGNPPFGHFGEAAINDWFTNQFNNLLPIVDSKNTKLLIREELKRDISHFEGNAQAIRLVHKLLRLNLTYSQVAAILKYTRCGTDVKPKPSDDLSYLKKKVGYYFSEQDYIEKLCQSQDMTLGHRHFASYIMEAADDISYCLADLEDAVEKNILGVEQLKDKLLEEYASLAKKYALPEYKIDSMKDILDYAFNSYRHDDICQDSQFFIALRVKVIHPLVSHAAKRFIDNVESIYTGSFNQALLEDKSHAHAITNAFKEVALKYVFCDPEVETRELQGYKIITGLLDCYKPLLQLTHTSFNEVIQQTKSAPLIEKRLYKKLPEKHIRAYKSILEQLPEVTEEFEFYYRCRLIQDYISGMTDQFAYDEYRALMVIE
ncbi:dGTPase [Marinomonas agarivorans]|nr:dGTPase [Marinomonas agarivorans]